MPEYINSPAGVRLNTYAGPASEFEPRTRVQVSALSYDTGKWQFVQMTLAQWAALCDGIRRIGKIDPMDTAPDVAATQAAVGVDNEQSEFRCPRCDALQWQGVLLLPGGIKVTCGACGWSDLVAEIERKLGEEEA